MRRIVKERQRILSVVLMAETVGGEVQVFENGKPIKSQMLIARL
jgi:hypothetical protein